MDALTGAPVSPTARAAEIRAGILADSRTWRLEPHILGYGIGPRRADGGGQDERCLKVFVREKSALSALSAPIPARMRIAVLGITVEIDVEPLPRLRPCGVLGQPPGGNAIRAETPDAAWGSYGCLLRSRFATRTYLLGCGHVLAPSDRSAAGDRLIIPGAGSRTRPAARLADWIAPVPSEAGFPNTVDAAIAEVEDPEVVDLVRAIHPRGVTADIRAGMTVYATGAASGRQRGVVTCERASLSVVADIPGLGQRRIGYRDQILCRDATAAGDSGACVVNERGRALGLHIWGSEPRSVAEGAALSVVTPMRAVLDAFAPGLDLGVIDDPETLTVSLDRPPVADIDDAVDVAARTIFAESRGEPPDSRLAIAEVIYNRAMRRSERFGTTVEAVCRKAEQFACWNPGHPYRSRILTISLADPEIADCVAIARDLIEGRVGALTMGADHYHHHRVSPAYSRLRTPCVRIGNHLFFNDIP